MSTAEIIFLAIYFGVLAVLSVYGSHRYRMAYLYYRHKYKLPTPKAPLKQLPRVTVQLPIFNEMYVVGAWSIRCAASSTRAISFEVQVLDDSTDETCGIARARVEQWKEKASTSSTSTGRTVRASRPARSRMVCISRRVNFVAVFDADFVPSPDFSPAPFRSSSMTRSAWSRFVGVT